MEQQVYRRRSTVVQPKRHKTESKAMGKYKKNMQRQALFCIAVFAFAIYVKASTDEKPAFIRQYFEYIITESTDFSVLPNRIQQLFKTGEFQRGEPSSDQDMLLNLSAPLSAPVTSGFGLRTHPVDGEEKFHYGIDLGAPEGEKIKCVASGEAVEVGESEEYGNYVLVKHSESIHSFYAHCQEVLPQPGDEIQGGQVIGTVGATGKTTGAHLHFELRNGDTWLDPMEFISFKEGGS